MLIKFIGHACFKIRDNETGYSIIFDPYQPDSVPGLGNIADIASEVLCSHDHFDHNSTASVKLEPKDESPYDVQVIDTWHDPEKGSLRGANQIHVITEKRTGGKLIHYGDIGEEADALLTDENLRILKGADIALIPVGGKYTYDTDQALELIRRTSPKVAVPMHFRIASGNVGFPDIGSIEDFLEKAQKAGFNVRLGKLSFFDVSTNSIDDCILAIRPHNML